MQDKISVYEEILAMEPGSKLFFSLAKMLVASGDYSKAEKILLQGLTAHPEYLEARLLLLDVLEFLGHEDDALEHCRGMLDLLKESTGFWAVWHRILAGNGERDTRTALGFVQASLQGKALAWTDIFEQGLGVALAHADDIGMPVAQPSEGDFDGQEPEAEESVSSSSLDAAVESGVEPKEDISPDAPLSAPESLAVSELETEDISEPEDALEQESKSEETQNVDSQSQPEPAPEIAKHIDLDMAPVAGTESAMPLENIPQVTEDVIEEREEEGEEPCQDADAEEVDDISIHSDVTTRTMADLLMEQEEYAQAAVIYEKLWKESAPGAERREIYDALEAARSNAGEITREEAGQSIGTDVPQGHEKSAPHDALKTLSALADRLEQRAKQ